MKNNKGITIIALTLTIVITLILAAVVVKYGSTEVNKAKLEDIKANMLLIKGRAQIAVDKASFDENYQETGVIHLNENISLPAGSPAYYNLDNLRDILNGLEDKTKLYIWENEAMQSNNIDISVTSDEFYVVDYNKMEVYYSAGFEKNDVTYYSLTELQGL